MMYVKKAIYKVPNGKLLKIFLGDVDGKITSIKITGDFFIHPEENIEKLEKALAGTELNEKNLMDKINEFLNSSPTTFFGLDVTSLVTTILSAN